MPTNVPIDLAPGHKQSLLIANPIILASGDLNAHEVGAVVTPPLSLGSRSGAPFPRVIEVPGGMLLRTGAANPGLLRFLKSHQQEFAAVHVPIIAAFAAQAVSSWAEMATRVERVPGLDAIELHLNAAIQATEAVRAVRRATELPILAKIDLESVVETAKQSVGAGANALVVGRAPRGMAVVSGTSYFGRLYSAAAKPLALRALSDVAALNLGIPLVANGGIYAPEDVQDCLSAGASAVEIDGAAWLDPSVVSVLVDHVSR